MTIRPTAEHYEWALTIFTRGVFVIGFMSGFVGGALLAHSFFHG